MEHTENVNQRAGAPSGLNDELERIARDVGVWAIPGDFSPTRSGPFNKKLIEFGERVACKCSKHLDLKKSEVRLMAGELTSQEMRTVMAVLAGVKARMRSNEQK